MILPSFPKFPLSKKGSRHCRTRFRSCVIKSVYLSKVSSFYSGGDRIQRNPTEGDICRCTLNEVNMQLGGTGVLVFNVLEVTEPKSGGGHQ